MENMETIGEHFQLIDKLTFLLVTVAMPVQSARGYVSRGYVSRHFRSRDQCVFD